MIKYAIAYSDQILVNLDNPVSQDHFLWLNPSTGKPFHPAHPSALMLRISKKCCIHVHPHQLCQYFATNAKTDNLPDVDVMHWLGHANIQQTNDYTRPTQRGAMGVSREFQKIYDNEKNVPHFCTAKNWQNKNGTPNGTAKIDYFDQLRPIRDF